MSGNYPASKSLFKVPSDNFKQVCVSWEKYCWFLTHEYYAVRWKLFDDGPWIYLRTRKHVRHLIKTCKFHRRVNTHRKFSLHKPKISCPGNFPGQINITLEMRNSKEKNSIRVILLVKNKYISRNEINYSPK